MGQGTTVTLVLTDAESAAARLFLSRMDDAADRAPTPFLASFWERLASAVRLELFS